MVVVLTRLSAIAGAAALVAALTGCGSASGWTTPRGSTVRVVAAFYALQFAAQQVGGSHVEVSGLTKPGAEPHDVELTPRQVGRVATADLVVYERGFQPAVDTAVTAEAAHTALDVSRAARLDLAAPAEDGGHDTADPLTPVDPRHHDATHATAPGHRDPHFWLDPLRYADVADAIAARLAQRDPGNAAAYEANAKAFRGTMTDLDADFRDGLADCRVRDLVTSHAAFGYLAERYGLHQVGISGLDPEAEPDPATLARVTAHVRETGATTVYAETLVSQAVARTLARETGARLAVLDPVEAITAASAGPDYPSVMRANLAILRTGQECS